jgi:menaquinone-dependent protoporphyrinogen oxidase
MSSFLPSFHLSFLHSRSMTETGFGDRLFRIRAPRSTIDILRADMKTVLVAYATRHGSTREVTAEVARILRQSGIDVEIRPAREVKSLDRYGAVVLGGALYMGRWHRDARKLLKRFRRALVSLPLAVFAMGPLDTESEHVEDARAQLKKALGAVSELHPFSTAIFGGVIDPSKLPFPINRMPASDARDWDAIRSWAEETGGELASR